MPMPSSPPLLDWRIRVMMAERGIKTIAELQRLLSEAGVQISATQLARIVDGQALRISTQVLAGLAIVLDCEIQNLVRISRR